MWLEKRSAAVLEAAVEQECRSRQRALRVAGSSNLSTPLELLRVHPQLSCIVVWRSKVAFPAHAQAWSLKISPHTDSLRRYSDTV